MSKAESVRLFLADSGTASGIFDEVADIHRERIPEGFLSSLGRGFLSLMYRGLASTPHSFLILAERRGRVVGFMCCSTNTGKAYVHFLLRHGWKAGWFVLPRVLRFSLVRKVFETLLYPSKKENRDLPDAEIFNFCVAAGAEGTGIGRALFEEMERELARSGVNEIKIVSGAEQRRAHHFYEKAGATLASGMRLHGEEESVIFVHSIGDGHPAERGR